MIRFLLVPALLFGGICGAQTPVTVAAASNVERAYSPDDTVVLTLPGSAPAAEAKAPEPTPPPAPERPKPELPEAFKRDSSVYLQRVIGIWKKRDAEALLGMPLRNRPAYDDRKRVNGQIFAWADPTAHYRELELDFEASSGTLRTVFVYPNQMTWDDCQKAWGAKVSSTHTKDGRSFYSYLNRKLDVLVDSDGKVISLGLY